MRLLNLQLRRNKLKEMEEEIESIKAWKLIEFPLRYKTIENKRIFKIKRKADSSIERYKTHLVVKEYI